MFGGVETWLSTTPCAIALLCEHHLPAHRLPALRSCLRKLGWAGVWGAASCSFKGLRSSSLGLASPPHLRKILDHRLTSQTLVPNSRPRLTSFDMQGLSIMKTMSGEGTGPARLQSPRLRLSSPLWLVGRGLPPGTRSRTPLSTSTFLTPKALATTPRSFASAQAANLLRPLANKRFRHPAVLRALLRFSSLALRLALRKRRLLAGRALPLRRLRSKLALLPNGSVSRTTTPQAGC